MLSTAKLVGFVATTKAPEAKKFYGEVLDLALVEDSPFALVFDANGTTLRIQKVQALSPFGYTALGWEVGDIDGLVQSLNKRGVRFERYSGLAQDDAGIWSAPGGARVAWFKDPDGNTLSITQEATPRNAGV